MDKFFEQAALQNHPLRLLGDFLKSEAAFETAKKYDQLRFVGYVLELGYSTATIITSDPFKVAVGGVPRNSLLIMVPSSYEKFQPHFTLLRVLESALTPLSKDVQQTYFELQKKSMPELDIFTQSELQWGALKTQVLGMFYPNPSVQNTVEFSGDLNNFVSAHKYFVYSPTKELLDLIVNSMVPAEGNFSIGKLRLTECRLTLEDKSPPDVNVHISTKDIKGCRTALFGKTRLGKSNVVKLLAQSIIETTGADNSVGQLIFDINGEYANDNPQDDNRSLKSGYPGRCEVYAFIQRPATPSRVLKLNFYENPDTCKSILRNFLELDGRTSGYIGSFASVEIPSLADIQAMTDVSEKNRVIRKLHMYWAILSVAGFPANEQRLLAMAPAAPRVSRFNPGFGEELRRAAFGIPAGQQLPALPNSLQTLAQELRTVNQFRRNNAGSPLLLSSSGRQLFEADELALLEFLDPAPGRTGPPMLQPYRIYHHQDAGDFVTEILQFMDQGKTVILDLGNADELIVKYFSDHLSKSVFRNQMSKFTSNSLGSHFVQLYFEEAHNLFPRDNDSTSIYSRFAKEGAKYHIGMVYSTQSPSTISRDLLAQTENVFVAHLSSKEEVTSLAKVNVAFEGLELEILHTKTPGYIRMLSRSHRFVVPVQANKFSPPAPVGAVGAAANTPAA